MIRTILIACLFLASIDLLADQADGLSYCAAKTDAENRLKCYDALANSAVESTRTTESIADSKAPQSKVIDDGIISTSNVSSFTNLWSIDKLESDNPNFFGYSGHAGTRERNVEEHIEFDISIKYPLWKWDHEGKGPDKLFFVYNGSYDFQALTKEKIYDSKPIISTSQNPGLALEWEIGDRKKRFRIGYFHHSNGQTLDDPQDVENPYQIDSRPGNSNQHGRGYDYILNKAGEVPAPVLERLSRSSWYWQYRYQWMSNTTGEIDNNWAQFQLEYRYLYNTDDRLFWLPDTDQQPRLQEFDGIRALKEKMFRISDDLRVLGRLEVQTGTSSVFENIGGKISAGINLRNRLGMDLRNVLFTLYYYNGFAKDISSYHERTRHWGLGMELR